MNNISNNATAGKTGLLVETIDGAEIIKSCGAESFIYSRWVGISKECISSQMAVRQISEKSTVLTHFFQQCSYITVLGCSAYLVAEGQISMGALTASTILTMRILGPIAMLPSVLSQYSGMQSSITSLNDIFSLETDNAGQISPIDDRLIRGSYAFTDVKFSYTNNQNPLVIQKIFVKPGEKIGVIGPIGSGKSTFLKLMTGMYKVNSGHLRLDGIDIYQYSRNLLSSNIGYLQQEHRLFNGTLRENLLLGIKNPGDSEVLEISHLTGLDKVIASHPQGLDMIITEGGRGLSGGQKQLVALTRLLIAKPQVLLLDEPTASMDSTLENDLIKLINSDKYKPATVVMVTHKPSLLKKFDRIIMFSNNKIILDGPRDWVFEKLSIKH